MATSTDIANRALQFIGTRTTIASLAEQSNEAIQINLVYNAVQDWCFGLANWNFARSVALLTVTKSVGPPVGVWTTASPAPPWLYEYLVPANFIRAQYLTNSAHVATTGHWDGEPQRMVVATDVIAAVQQQVILTNATPAILFFTIRLTDPTLWPWYFERLMVQALAWTVSYVLTGDKALLKILEDNVVRQFSIADQANREEGLFIKDSTPQWIQALGIPYPQDRLDIRAALIQAPKNDNQR